VQSITTEFKISAFDEIIWYKLNDGRIGFLRRTHSNTLGRT
jgi:hypothetical protein